MVLKMIFFRIVSCFLTDKKSWSDEIIDGIIFELYYNCKQKNDLILEIYLR